MDLDIEMGDMADPMQDAPVDEQPQDDILGGDDPEEPGEIADTEPAADESKTIVPSKLHIRGLDTLHTDDIKAYVKAHFGVVDRVEWIDDTSANLLFNSEATARDALKSLSTIEVADPTALAIGETLPAKPLEGRPEINLSVRFTLESDKKEAGAAARSRYYLLHPEHDPEERRRRHQDNRSRYRDRDGDRRRRRRDSDEPSTRFEASMYDDAPASERRQSDEEERSRSYAQENRGKELFSTRRGSGRGRSASPARDRDSDVDLMGERASSASNRNKARNIKGRLSAGNTSKELFPSKMASGRGRLDELEDAIGSAHLREEDRPKIVSAPDRPGPGFSIKGSAAQVENGRGGFSIKGAANAKELFPDKLGGENNAGKELFDSSRRRRQRAEDLFS
ncbi:hypothetical protein NLU13_1632 [Sarocladium strictum]|uniref:Uncharacterized protein n=1 Tax=Sarocladium strictum TaxID=5046 RepID=A0AA39LCP5_SARSR|nr:hypothetical protein NLU13_1632 [Sarocladium strictum]